MLESIDVVLARSSMGTPGPMPVMPNTIARLAQSAERKALNLVVVGSSPTVGVLRSMLWATHLQGPALSAVRSHTL